MPLRIHSQSRRAFTRRQRPLALDLRPIRVKAHERVLAFNVYKYISIAVCRGKLWYAAERNRGNDFLCYGVDDARIMTVGIEGIDALLCGLVQDRIGGVPNLDFLRYRIRFEIEHD